MFGEGTHEVLYSNFVSSSGLYQLRLQVGQLWSRKVTIIIVVNQCDDCLLVCHPPKYVPPIFLSCICTKPPVAQRLSWCFNATYGAQ